MAFLPATVHQRFRPTFEIIRGGPPVSNRHCSGTDQRFFVPPKKVPAAALRTSSKPCSEIAEAAENPRDEQPTNGDELAETKRMLTEFPLTLSMARADLFDRAVGNVTAPFARHTGRYPRTVAGKEGGTREPHFSGRGRQL